MLDNEQKIDFKKAFVDKKILICDPYHLANALIKRTLNFYGADFSNIYTTQSIEDSLNVIESIEPEYVFTFHRDKKSDTCEELYLKHIKQKNDRTQNCFFLLVLQDNALYASSFKRKYPMNGISFEPFTATSIEKSILTMLKRSSVKNKYLDLMNKGHTLLNGGFFKDAEIQFSQAYNYASFDPADSLFYQGLCQINSQQEEQAIESWYKALDFCLHHPKALRELFLLHHRKKEFELAYKLQLDLLKNHPIDPMLIPHYILISVRMKKYGEIYDLALQFQKLNYKVKEIERSIAAGLIMSGRYFIANKEKDLGRKILLKAAELAKSNFEMFQNISNGLLDGGFFVDAYELIGKKVEEYPSNTDFKILEIDLLFKANELPKTLEQGMILINENIFHPNLYHNVILASIKIGRNKKLILDLIETACTMFPEDAEKYLRIREHYFAE